MTLTAKPGRAAAPPARSRWEERSTHRVLAARREQILERSRQLVEAAYRLLEEKGLEGLTIRAVLERTALSRRAFYERFADKDELVLAVFEQAILMATRRFREQIGSIGDPVARLELIVTNLVLAGGSPHGPADAGRRSAAMSREHLRLAESRPDDLQAALSPLLNLIAEQLSSGMKAGAVRREDPARLAALLYNLVSTTVHTELLTRSKARADWAKRVQLAAETWEFCRRAIAA